MQRYSRLFGKTVREAKNDMKFASHRLLYQAGFVRESTAGRYYYLPLGWRVHEKIKKVVKDEMDKAGAQEMIAPVLHPLELWQETNRTKTTGFELMGITDQRGAKFALGGTAEEMFVDLVRQFQVSYKDMPFNVYQFSTKFRDERRARGGLLRVREFVMKDAYSFDVDEEAFKQEYEKMSQTYTNIFKRLGLETKVVEADNGYIGGEYCHEFQVEHKQGEGHFFVTEKGDYVAHEDVANFILEPVNPEEKEAPFQIIEQPEWVRTMEEFKKHYNKDERYFLKNVVYRTTQGDLVIVTIRGDLDVNKAKLEHLLDMVGQIEDGDLDDLTAIGTKFGFVHSWGHGFVKPRKAKTEDRYCKVIYVADDSLKTVKNFIGGQKQETTDSINVNYGRDFKHEIEGDVAMAKDGFTAPDGKSKLIGKRGIEVGNIFQLGYHYTTLMANALFTDKDGKRKKYYMGCYGIGLGRTLATIVEKNNDDKGIIWPEVVAPYDVHFITLDKDLEQQATDLINKIESEKGKEVLWDDRDNATPGQKFADADLIGIPRRIILSKRSLEKGGVEVTDRRSGNSEIVAIDQLMGKL